MIRLSELRHRLGKPIMKILRDALERPKDRAGYRSIGGRVLAR
jgi:hypothetical protein